MKNLLNYSIFTSIILLLSCAKKKEEPKPLAPTAISFSIKDGTGNNVSGATIKLYSSRTNFENQTNQIGSTIITDSNGNASISGVDALQYFWFVEKDCQNNFNGGVTSTTPLAANTNTRFTVILSETGSITYQNNSNNPYRVFLNGNQLFDLPGNTSRIVRYIPTGNFTVRALQLSGFLLTPTEVTATNNLACGSSLLFQFP